MNIIFLNYMVPREQSSKYAGISIAGNKMQINVAEELSNIENCNVNVLSLEPYACFPKDKIKIVKGKKQKLNNIDYQTISYINLPILKQVSQIYFMKKELKKFKNSNDTIVMGFNLFPQIGIPFQDAIKNNMKAVCLLADVPIDDATQRSIFSKILRYFFDSNTRSNLLKCDNYIVLSKYVAKEYLKKNNALVIEGGVDRNDVQKKVVKSFNKNSNEKIIITFSGALTEYNGIRTLLKSFEYIDNKKIKLNIYGNGDLKSEVIKSQENDSRIQYCGVVNNEKMRQIQKESDILINPRQIDNIISRYTFPSKTFEYFLSQVLVISTKVPSYPDEYLDKMIIAEDSPKGIADAIEKAINMDSKEKERMINRAYEFVINEKTWEKQANKIYSFLENVLNG